jgi:hypothetical protein
MVDNKAAVIAALEQARAALEDAMLGMGKSPTADPSAVPGEGEAAPGGEPCPECAGKGCEACDMTGMKAPAGDGGMPMEMGAEE